MSKVPTIPDFDPNVASSIGATVRTLKMAVEVLGGLKQGEAIGCPLVYVQGHDPLKDARNTLSIGDQWIDTTTNKMNYWSGGAWVQLS